MEKLRYDSDPIYRDAVASGASGDHARAASLYRLLVGQGEETASLRWMLGCEYLDQGNYDNAVHEFLRAVELDEASAPAWQGMGRAYRRMGNFAKAEKAFRRTLELDRRVENFVYLANVLRNLKRYEEATDACEEAVKIDPQYEEAYLNLGMNLHAQGSYDSAVSALRTAVRLDPDYADAYFVLGNVFLEMGQPELAAAAYADDERIRESRST